MQDKTIPTTGQPSTAIPTKGRDSTDFSRPSTSAYASPGESSSPSSVGASSTGVTDQAKETMSNMASQAGGKVASRINTQKDKAAEGVESVAQALRQTSDQLREKNQEAVVHEYVSSAADQVERLSGYLRSTNLSRMVSDAEQLARRQPAVFIGSAFVLGLLGARFLKSSGSAGTRGSAPQYPGTTGSQYGAPSSVTPAQGRKDY